MPSQTVNMNFNDYTSGGSFVNSVNDELPYGGPTGVSTGGPWALAVEVLVADAPGQAAANSAPAMVRQTLVCLTSGNSNTAAYVRYRLSVNGVTWTSWQQIPA